MGSCVSAQGEGRRKSKHSIKASHRSPNKSRTNDLELQQTTPERIEQTEKQKEQLEEEIKNLEQEYKETG